MNRTHRARVLVLALGFAACGLAMAAPLASRAQDAVKEVAGTKLDDSSVVSDVRVRTLKESNYIYAETETSMAEMGPFIQETVGKLEAAAAAGKIDVSNAFVFVYQGATADPNTKFKLQVGAQVSDATKEVDGLKLRKLPAYRCASVVFQGSLQDMMQPYAKLLSTVEQSGLERTGETREYYAYWEGETSRNNILMVTAGVKEAAKR